MGYHENIDKAQPRARRVWPVYLVIVAGVLITVTGWALTHTTLLLAWKGGDADQVSPVCTSALGAIAQSQSTGVAHDCHVVALAQQISGIMLGLGALVIVAGGVWLYRRMRTRAAVTPKPAMYPPEAWLRPIPPMDDYTTSMPITPQND